MGKGTGYFSGAFSLQDTLSPCQHWSGSRHRETSLHRGDELEYEHVAVVRQVNTPANLNKGLFGTCLSFIVGCVEVVIEGGECHNSYLSD